MLYGFLIGAGACVAVLVLLVALATVLGRRLPPDHTVQAVLRVGKPMHEVFGLIDNLEAQPTWDKGVTRVETLPQEAGQRRRRMYMGRNVFVLTDTTREPPTRLVRTIADDHKFFGGSWTFDLAPDAPNATKVTLTEHGTISAPIARFMMKHFVDPAMYLRRQLAAMARALGEEPRISDAKRIR